MPRRPAVGRRPVGVPDVRGGHPIRPGRHRALGARPRAPCCARTPALSSSRFRTTSSRRRARRRTRRGAPSACRSTGPSPASLGVVTPAKRVGKVLEALASLPAARRPFLFVGGAVAGGDPLQRYVKEHGLAGDVAFGGHLSEEDFWRAASAADFAVNLRHPTMGETSGAVCRLAGFGLPLVVSDTGWFRELPDDFATKVPVDGDEVGSSRPRDGASRVRAGRRAEPRAARRPPGATSGARPIAPAYRRSSRASRSGDRSRAPFVRARRSRAALGRASSARSRPSGPESPTTTPSFSRPSPPSSDARAWQPKEARRGPRRPVTTCSSSRSGTTPSTRRPSRRSSCPERRTPAVVVLHEFVLHHLFAARLPDARPRRSTTRGSSSARTARAGGRSPRRLGGALPRAGLGSRSVGVSDVGRRHSRRGRRHRALRARGGAPSSTACPGRARRDDSAARRACPALVARGGARAPSAFRRIARSASRSGSWVRPSASGRSSRRSRRCRPRAGRFSSSGAPSPRTIPCRAFVREHGLAGDVRFGGYLSEEDFFGRRPPRRSR